MAEPRPAGEIYGYTFDECFRDLLFYLSRYPDFVCAPRGQKIKECLAQTLVLEDPRARLILNPARKANYGFAAGEFLWYWQGRRDLEMMCYYNRRMAGFSDDGLTLNSAYGHRIHGTDEFASSNRQLSQWEVCVRTLVEDPESRRAILHINRSDDQETAVRFGSKDVPCTLSLQFFVRQGRLHMHVTMRSNDIVWGLTNDLFSFTLFQECMLLELTARNEKFRGLEMGSYYHTVGSLHLYERHFQLAEDCLEKYRTGWPEPEGTRDDMPALTGLHELSELADLEMRLRKRTIDLIDVEKFSGGERWLAERLNEHRQKRDAEESPQGEQNKAG
jgi:thymidylate synthase